MSTKRKPVDYKKKYEEEKKLRMLTAEKYYMQLKENVSIINENINLKKQLEDNKSWEACYNKKQGESEGIMRCFKHLLSVQNAEKIKDIEERIYEQKHPF